MVGIGIDMVYLPEFRRLAGGFGPAPAFLGDVPFRAGCQCLRAAYVHYARAARCALPARCGRVSRRSLCDQRSSLQGAGSAHEGMPLRSSDCRVGRYRARCTLSRDERGNGEDPPCCRSAQRAALGDKRERVHRSGRGSGVRACRNRQFMKKASGQSIQSPSALPDAFW